MSPNFFHRYDLSVIFRYFSSKLRGNCPRILFLCHLSFVFSVMTTSICLIRFCNFSLRFLAFCNIIDFVSCWWVLTLYISGFALLSTHSTSFTISNMYAPSRWISPIPPCFLETYKRSTSALQWCCPWMISSYLVFLSNFHTSCFFQLIIPKLCLSNRTSSHPIASILFFAFNSVFKTPSSTFLSHSYILCHDSLPSFNTYTFFSNPVL